MDDADLIRRLKTDHPKVWLVVSDRRGDNLHPKYAQAYLKSKKFLVHDHESLIDAVVRCCKTGSSSASQRANNNSSGSPDSGRTKGRTKWRWKLLQRAILGEAETSFSEHSVRRKVGRDLYDISIRVHGAGSEYCVCSCSF